MKISRMLSSALASRMLLIHPPEPRKELLLSSPSKGIYIGRTRYAGVPVFWDYSKLINPHIAIIGITGSGKSYFVKSFLTRTSLVLGSNAIILDWVGEYSSWVKQAGGKVIDLSKEKLNLFDISHSSKSIRIRQIISAFDVLANLKKFPQEREEIEQAIEDVFRKMKKPKLIDVISLLESKKRKTSSRILKRFVQEGMDFFSGYSDWNMKKLASSGLVSIDLHNLPSEEIRSLAGLTILQYIKELMRQESYDDNVGINLFVVLDEAWKIASNEESDVIDIVREGRKYNFALIVASQNPTDMHKTIFSNVGSLFILRLVLQEYRKYVQNSVGYSEFIDSEISKFGVGNCAINMIFSERQAKSTTFLLDRIDGEEPLFIYTLSIGDGNMEMELEKEQLIRMLFEHGLDDSQVSLIKNEFEKNDGKLSGERIVSLFEKFGFSKSSTISFLRLIGVPEKEIIHLFSLVKMRRAKKGVVDITMDD
ncbi:MAG: ATP-binding protein [Candidatus ainarchaeum sp.]|nr:ATP-binding protein [Candidatus ainarchaeum sp.]